MQCIVCRTDAVETVVVLGIEDRVSVRIARARHVIVGTDHFVSRDLHRVPGDGLLQSVDHAQVHVVVFATPTPVHRRIAIGADEVS